MGKFSFNWSDESVLNSEIDYFLQELFYNFTELKKYNWTKFEMTVNEITLVFDISSKPANHTLHSLEG